MEFLGDAVLELVVTNYLFSNFKKKEEGELTIYRAALVNTKTLSEVAEHVGLDKAIMMSRGERKDFDGKAKESISANSVEALIGAVYLDQGYEVVREFIVSNIVEPRVDALRQDGGKDAKSLVQEFAQSKHKVTPNYTVLEETGPAHDREFKVGLYFNGKVRSEGEGKSKQEAEIDAAQKFLDSLEE